MSIGWLLMTAAGVAVASTCAVLAAILIVEWLDKLAEKWNTEE